MEQLESWIDGPIHPPPKPEPIEPIPLPRVQAASGRLDTKDSLRLLRMMVVSTSAFGTIIHLHHAYKATDKNARQPITITYLRRGEDRKDKSEIKKESGRDVSEREKQKHEWTDWQTALAWV